MSTLTSASTYTEILAAYRTNASYEEDASVSKAKAFITACRFLLQMPSRVVHGGRGGGEEMEHDPAVVQEEMKQARRWQSSQPSAGGGGAIYQDFRDMRV